MKRNIEVDIQPTPTELAGEFCEMSDVAQAEFFNKVGQLSLAWPKPFCFQMQAILDTEILDEAGRSVMKTIGDYAIEP